MNAQKERRRIKVKGIVQGVGFRPFVYALAQASKLSGFVRNDAAGVTIEVEGSPSALEVFAADLCDRAPPLAVIERVSVEKVSLCSNGHGAEGFVIAASQADEARSTFISPDMATCDDCLAELFDPADRRYLYPFINCTHCGPRYTITRDVPYDRPLTTMAPFEMCAECSREYEDPGDRRFHAQPVACPACGPQVKLITWDADKHGSARIKSDNLRVHPRSSASDRIPWEGHAAIARTQELLAQGKIVAIKGLGGYHLACDATDPAAVRRLRQRKQRWDKPFALMAADLATIETVCEVNWAERDLLLDRRRPIVLLRRRRYDDVPPEVAPAQNTLGIMLPYTPLHSLLFHPANLPGHQVSPLLVMTSGNLSDEPIAYQDEDAFERLSGIADAFLTHNRDIYIRCDDSVMRVVSGQWTVVTGQSTGMGGRMAAGKSKLVTDDCSLITVPVRRSRGYAPQPLLLGFEFERPVLAAGGHLKNAFCLGKGRYAYMSHHIGDLDNLETLQSFERAIGHYQRIFDIQPESIAHDLHPDYLSTKWASEQGVALVPVQHHHAHIASVLAEHRLPGPVIGVAFDGTGYGLDGNVWGGEFLLADLAGFKRLAHLAYVPLPGGERAIQQPWRVAGAWLNQIYGEDWLTWNLDFCRGIDREKWRLIKQMIDRGLNSPLTSSMGRLFDAVAALLGVRREVNYEGQAAMELEALADERVQEGYTFECQTIPAGQDGVRSYLFEPRTLFDEILHDLQNGVPVPVMSGKFHNGVAGMLALVCEQLRDDLAINQVALSGGVFQNKYLLAGSLQKLESLEFEVFTNRSVPPNDGGLSLGQAAITSHVGQTAEEYEIDSTTSPKQFF